MDANANIRPLKDFPEDEREMALKRFRAMEAGNRKELEALLTEEGIAKLEAAEAEFERRVIHGEDE